MNYNRHKGETLLASQGWVKYLDVVPNLDKTGKAKGRITTDGWQYNDLTPLKEATKIVYNKNRVVLHVRTHLDTFSTSHVFVPDHIIVELLESRAFNGDSEYYLFAFQKLGLIEFRQVVKSEA